MKCLLILLLLGVHGAMAQQSPHGQLFTSCDVCHSTDSWAYRKDASFDHNSTRFPLLGRHKVIECNACHADLVFSEQKEDCLSCHTDVHKSELGANCLRCHTMNSWIITDMKQKHQQTRFPLLGAHATALCRDCHDRTSEHRYAGTPLTCITCHRPEYQAAANPNHVSEGFPVACDQCHRVDKMTWSSGFDHSLTGFPLTGAHRTVICSQCHAGNQFTALSTDCYSCHQKDYAAAQSPNHLAGNFSHNCQACHTTNAWQPATFDHNATRFPLTGAHTSLACEECHRNGNYQLVYTSCDQCHGNDFQQSINPNHVGGNFSHDCVTCHTTAAWSPATFNHSVTIFPLTGSHVAVPCLSCHTNSNYQIAYTDCYACHQTDYQRPADPNHVTANFSHTCQPCHTTTAWNPSTFDHSTTKFSLTGAHLTASCQSCHTNGNYQLSYVNCYQCHQGDYTGTTNPNHAAGGFSQNCLQCHSTAAWSPATFDHSTTKFPLTGAHTTTACQSCHTNGSYQLVYTDCYACHQTDYQKPTNPNHVAANFGHDCSPCHTTTAWSPSTFNHDGLYFKIYSGAHNGRWTYCTDCHTTQTDYSQFTCVTCHNQSETNSNHQGVTGYVYSNPACYNCHKSV